MVFAKLSLSMKKQPAQIAYFSMEVGLDGRMPTYAGGLGILAGDTLKTCADLELPVVGVTLLNERGYFRQKLDAQHNQVEEPENWSKEELLSLTPAKVTLKLTTRSLQIRAWQYLVEGTRGFTVPVYFLDTNFGENDSYARQLTSYLYGGNNEYRLYQELILGIGGLKILRALGYHSLHRYHLNEGHSAFLLMELCREARLKTAVIARRQVGQSCVFTTHTPLPGGHDRFSKKLLQTVVPKMYSRFFLTADFDKGQLNTTRLALNSAFFVNGVAQRHRQVTKKLFPGHHIEAITNGVHSRTWTSPDFQRLFDRYLHGWETNPSALRYALGIPNQEIWEAHQESKRRLIDEVNRGEQPHLTYKDFTIGIARRFAPYKRSTLILSQPDRLRRLAVKYGGLQIIFAGKAFPTDMRGEGLIKEVFAAQKELAPEVKVIFLENYDIRLAKLLTSGVDLWLNNPLRPFEASGTSGMKAAHNGIPQCSTLDGWWLEGHLEGVTGWTIGKQIPTEDLLEDSQEEQETEEDLYTKLEKKILPTFCDEPEKWQDIMRHTIAFNASFFNTTRMVQQYLVDAYY